MMPFVSLDDHLKSNENPAPITPIVFFIILQLIVSVCDAELFLFLPCTIYFNSVTKFFLSLAFILSLEIFRLKTINLFSIFSLQSILFGFQMNFWKLSKYMISC